jgi:cytochrome d ubiquinol oxidase subunit II
MSFVQGGQTLLLTCPRSEGEKTLILNSLGRKWELTFTLLVLLGGALFAAFPNFYATSFSGAYWVWMFILITYVLQAVSYEYRKKPGNLLGARTYEWFLFINGSLGLFAVGAMVGTLYTGGNFIISENHLSRWGHPAHGLEALLVPFNLALGLLFVFLARLLGSLYLINNLSANGGLTERLRKSSLNNLLALLPFLLFILFRWRIMTGYGYTGNGEIILVKGKYFQNLLELPVPGLGFLLTGLILIAAGVLVARFSKSSGGIWMSGSGTVLTGMALFLILGLNRTAFYPSLLDLQSSLTIENASSSYYTLSAMTQVALAVPFILAYVCYVWRLMNAEKISTEDIEDKDSRDLY